MDVDPLGCAYDNPPCHTRYNCVDNRCVKDEDPEGCAYNNPPCGEGYDCINNQCIDQGTELLSDLDIKSFTLVTSNNGNGEIVYEAILQNIGEITARDVSWEVKDVNGNTLTGSGNRPISAILVVDEKMVYPVFEIDMCPLRVDLILDPHDEIKELNENNNQKSSLINSCIDLKDLKKVEPPVYEYYHPIKQANIVQIETSQLGVVRR